MRIFKLLAQAAVFVLAIGYSAARTQSPPPAKSSPPEERKSLLRMDLLRLPQEEMAPLRRNIFAPGSAASRSVDIAPQGSQVWGTDDEPVDQADLPAEGVATPPVIAINLRYIGYIESSKRMIALVVFEGLALAVAEGEALSEGVRVGKITREQVEVVLPDSSTRAFSLEGE